MELGGKHSQWTPQGKAMLVSFSQNCTVLTPELVRIAPTDIASDKNWFCIFSEIGFQQDTIIVYIINVYYSTLYDEVYNNYYLNYIIMKLNYVN